MNKFVCKLHGYIVYFYWFPSLSGVAFSTRLGPLNYQLRSWEIMYLVVFVHPSVSPSFRPSTLSALTEGQTDWRTPSTLSPSFAVDYKCNKIVTMTHGIHLLFSCTYNTCCKYHQMSRNNRSWEINAAAKCLQSHATGIQAIPIKMSPSRMILDFSHWVMIKQ